MRTYKIELTVEDFDNPNKINHVSKHYTELNEDTFNIIYKIICK
jgi:hypothetical protein